MLVRSAHQLAEDGCAGALACTRTPEEMRTSETSGPDLFLFKPRSGSGSPRSAPHRRPCPRQHTCAAAAASSWAFARAPPRDSQAWDPWAVGDGRRTASRRSPITSSPSRGDDDLGETAQHITVARRLPVCLVGVARGSTHPPRLIRRISFGAGIVVARARSATAHACESRPGARSLAHQLAEDGCAGALACTRTSEEMRTSETSDQIFFLFQPRSGSGSPRFAPHRRPCPRQPTCAAAAASSWAFA